MSNNVPPDSILQLIERFDRNLDSYHSGHYNEMQLRQEFLNPFFIALGWDVDNRQGYAPAYRDVIFEDSLKVGGETKAPDYCFQIGGMRKFFVEAKKPSVNIGIDIGPAFQLRRYAWTAKLPLSILTDFEEFAVYDCRQKPIKTDKASIARIKHLTYKDFPDHWQELWTTFSREAVLKGSFDNFVEETRAKKGTTEVDDAFLADIERWRDSLARNIALRNPRLTTRQLNEAVQRTIDRIIFLRICEDRSIEHYGQLQTLLNGERVYPRLRELFHKADDIYNSGLFHFQAEKGRPEPPDELTLNLSIDDKILKDIIGGLYYPDSPYEFSVLPADILGQVYEQFLGKVIRLTAGHQAKVEEKPEVRKAGGVYYTPTYIVDYIVKNTVGNLLEKKTPKQATSLRILDPACGSGSFLLGAYQYFLNWHRDWYVEDGPNKHTKELFQGQGGEWRLTTAKKKEILLNNIYGVDIDSQAVEVTKLSLLLKVLEGESEQTIQNQLKFFHDRALPDLGNNIKCGNSLIGPDFYESQQTSLFQNEEERLRINVFDWNTEFKDIIKSGGFDSIIGNPPYGADFGSDIKYFLSRIYGVAIPVTDSFVLFTLKAVELLNNNGIQGFILPSTWLYMPMYGAFRKRLLTGHDITSVVLFRSPVFAGVTVETCIEFIQRIPRPRGSVSFSEVQGEPSSFSGTVTMIDKLSIMKTTEATIYGSPHESRSNLFHRLTKDFNSLGSISQIVCGLTPYREGKGLPPQSLKIVQERAFDATRKIDGTYRRYIMGRDFHRFCWQFTDIRWISYGDWLAEPRYTAPFDDAEKIVIRQTADRIIAQIDTQKFLSLKNVHNLRVTNKALTYPYLLGLLNSSLLTWWYQQLIPEKGRVFAEVKVVNLKKLPIRILNLTNATDKARHDKMVELVERMLKLHKDLPKAKTAHEKTTIERQIQATDKQIDSLFMSCVD